MIDSYAVSVVKDNIIVGHLSRAISRICSLFLLSLVSVHYKGNGRIISITKKCSCMLLIS